MHANKPHGFFAENSIYFTNLVAFLNYEAASLYFSHFSTKLNLFTLISVF